MTLYEEFEPGPQYDSYLGLIPILGLATTAFRS